MKEPIVTNSTCLIALERIAQLELLPALFEPILAPPKVHEEFGVSCPWLRVQPIVTQATVTALLFMMGPGEAEAIALAVEQKCRVILDDRKARQIAGQMGLKVIGTVGVLLKAKQCGNTPQIKPLLDALQASNFRLSAPLRAEALRLAGE